MMRFPTHHLPVTNSEAVDVLVIGAGLAGLSAARDLTRAGFAVRVLDKSRGVGGRTATRRVDGATFDHGAPFFTVRGQRFAQLVTNLETQGVIGVWTHGFHTWANGVLTAPETRHARRVGRDGMNALGKAFRDGVDFGDATLHVQTNAIVSAAWSTTLGWSVVLESGEILNARSVLVATPAPQALALTRSSLESSTMHALERVAFDPCWALMAILETAPNVPWRGLKLQHPILEWASVEHTKRLSAPALVLHATPQWSREHLEQHPDQIIPALLEASRAVLGDLGAIRHVTAHRWRYARAVRMHPEPYLAQHDLVFCGDWCDADGHGSRVENALESGWAAASYLCEHLEQPMSAILTDVI
jgi:renalase